MQPQPFEQQYKVQIYKYEVRIIDDRTKSSFSFYSPKLDFKKGDIISCSDDELIAANTSFKPNTSYEFEIDRVIWESTPPDFETYEPCFLPILVGEIQVYYAQELGKR